MQDCLCDATEHPLAQVGVTIGAHDDEIGTESGGLRQQKVTHIFSSGRQASYLDSHAVTRQMAGDVRTRLLAVIRQIEQAFAIGWPKHFASGHGGIRQGKVVGTRFAGNRDSSASGFAQQPHASRGTQMLAMHLRSR